MQEKKISYQKRIFCKGLLCNKWNNRVKCFNCGVYICKICQYHTQEDNKIRCINCYLGKFSPDWDKINKEFEEMITNLNNKKIIESEKNKINV